MSCPCHLLEINKLLILKDKLNCSKNIQIDETSLKSGFD